MTHFEFVMVAYSIVVALAVSRCLDALPSASDRDRRYWVHLTWIAIKLMNPVMFWWGMWQFRELEWTFPLFFGSLVPVALLYVQIIYLVTLEPDSVSSWRDHYFSRHREFFGINFVFVLILFLANFSTLSWPGYISVLQIGLLAGSLAAAFSTNERLHSIFACYAAAVVFGAFVTALSS